MSMGATPIRADSTITLPRNIWDRVIVVANFTLEKGDKVAYSYNATDVVDFLVHAYLPGSLSSPLSLVLSITNSSAHGTVVAPWSGEWVYRFAFKNPSESSAVTITFDLREVGPAAALMILGSLAGLAVLFLIVIVTWTARRAVDRRGRPPA